MQSVPSGTCRRGWAIHCWTLRLRLRARSECQNKAKYRHHTLCHDNSLQILYPSPTECSERLIEIPQFLVKYLLTFLLWFIGELHQLEHLFPSEPLQGDRVLSVSMVIFQCTFTVVQSSHFLQRRNVRHPRFPSIDLGFAFNFTSKLSNVGLPSVSPQSVVIVAVDVA